MESTARRFPPNRSLAVHPLLPYKSATQLRKKNLEKHLSAKHAARVSIQALPTTAQVGSRVPWARWRKSRACLPVGREDAKWICLKCLSSIKGSHRGRFGFRNR